MRSTTFRTAILALTCVFAAVACSAATAAKKKKVGGDAENTDYSEPQLPSAPPPDVDNSDSGGFMAPGDRPRDASTPKTDGSRGNPVSIDGGTDDGSRIDSGVVTACPGPLASGDLAIVEMMIDSASGAGDHGEWVEIQSTRGDCTLNLKGLRIESPRGTDFDFIEVTDDMLLEPNSTFLVGDTADNLQNHTLPGMLLTWNATDALKNDGDTVTVKLGNTVIDELTYGSWGASFPGRSLSFSVDCAWAVRSDWERWTWSATEWTTGFMGTPNADNADVACY